MPGLIIIIGALAAGVAALWAAWGRDDARRALLLLAGWGLIAAGLAAWTARYADSGFAIAAASVIALAYLFLAVSARRARRLRKDGKGGAPKGTRAPSRGAPPDRDDALRASWKRYLENGATCLLAGPLSGIAALLLGLSAMKIAQSLGANQADAIVTAYVAVPLLWAGCAAYAVIDDTLKRKAPVLAALSGVSALHLALLA